MLTTSSPSSAREPLGFPCLFGKLHGMSSARARSRASRTVIRACRQHSHGHERERSSGVVDTCCTTHRARGDVRRRCTPNSLMTNRLRCAAPCPAEAPARRALRAAACGKTQDAAKRVVHFGAALSRSRGCSTRSAKILPRFGPRRGRRTDARRSEHTYIWVLPRKTCAPLVRTDEGGACSSGARGGYAAGALPGLISFPRRRHWVQTFTRCTLPSTTARTR